MRWCIDYLWIKAEGEDTKAGKFALTAHLAAINVKVTF